MEKYGNDKPDIRTDKNVPFYIGIGETEERAHSKKNRTKIWKNIANKGYETEILFDDLTWEQACEKEKEFIKLYGRKDLGTGSLVNMTDGGDGIINQIVSKETRQKMSNSIKGKIKGIKKTEEQKQKISDKLKGRKLPEETKQKMSNSGKGRIFSEEHKKKIGEANKLRKYSEETKQKMSMSAKNKINKII